MITYYTVSRYDKIFLSKYYSLSVLLIFVAYLELLNSLSIDSNNSKLEEIRGINYSVGLNYYVFELFINQAHDLDGRRFLAEKSQRVGKSKSNIFNTKKVQQCKDSGEAYSAAYLIHKDHLLNQFTNYNLTWVNCEMG